MVHTRTPWIFQDLAEELDRMSRSNFLRRCGADASQNPGVAALQVRENEASYTLDLPGVAEEDLELVLEHDRLRIQARRDDVYKESDKVLLRERSYGEFTQELKLPWPVRENEVEASLKQGVLQLVLKRSPEAGPRKIKVKSN